MRIYAKNRGLFIQNGNILRIPPPFSKIKLNSFPFSFSSLFLTSCIALRVHLKKKKKNERIKEIAIRRKVQKYLFFIYIHTRYTASNGGGMQMILARVTSKNVQQRDVRRDSD